MKVIKINKSFRNGVIEHFLVLLNETYSNDDIEYLVEEWCDGDLSGSNYGYSYKWSFVEDSEIIKTVLEKNIKNINLSIENLEEEKWEIEKYLFDNLYNKI